MAGTRRVLRHLSVKAAGRAAGCKHDAEHRVAKGELRLIVKTPGPAASEQGYCVDCGIKILEAAERDVQRLQEQLLSPDSE